MAWIGRKALGEEIKLTVQCTTASRVPTAPDQAPTYRVYTEAGVLVTNGSLPPTERYQATGLFEYMLPLNSSFSTGRYFVRYAYVISSVTLVPEYQDSFEIVAGGSTDGMINSMFYLDRPDGKDFILSSTDMGTLGASRGPRI